VELIEPQTESMGEYRTQEPSRQMPQVTCPHALYQEALTQLPEHNFDTLAYAGEHLACRRVLVLAALTVRSQKLYPSLRQLLSKPRCPVVAVPNHDAHSLLGKIREQVQLVNVGRSKLHSGDHSGPAYSGMHSQPIEGLACRSISAERSYLPQALTLRCSGKSTYRHREAVYESQPLVMRALPDKVEPGSFLHLPQIGRLSGEGGAVQVGKSREEVEVVSAKIVEECFVLAQTKLLPDHFHGEHLAIRKDRLWSSPTQPTPSKALQTLFHSIVHVAKHRYNEAVQVHLLPPTGTSSTPIVGIWTWLFNLSPQTCTSR
jgi:hypothetical protein